MAESDIRKDFEVALLTYREIKQAHPNWSDAAIEDYQARGRDLVVVAENSDDSTDLSKGNRNLISEALASIGSIYSSLDRLVRGKVGWAGEWAGNRWYQLRDMVTDNGWLMIANNRTTDRAAPIPLGISSFILPDAPSWLIENVVNSVNSGATYIFSEAGWVTQIRVWAPEVTETTNYRIVIVNNADPTNPKITVINDPVLNPNQWTVVSAGNAIARAGDELIVYLDALNSGSDTQVTGGWLYGGSGNLTPAVTEWVRRTQQDIVSISKTDLDMVDRSTELLGITADSTLQFVQTDTPDRFYVYRTLANPVDMGTYYDYSVILVDESLGGVEAGNASTLTATIPVAQSTQYVELAGYWPANQPTFAAVSGFLQIGGVDQVATDDAFGVDIRFQRASISPDWDYASLSSLSESSSTALEILAGLSSKINMIERLAEQTTNNEFDVAPVTAVTESLNLLAGDYTISFNFDAMSSNTNRSVVVALYIDNVLVDDEFSMEPKDSANNLYSSKLFPWDFLTGYHEFRVDFGRRGPAGAQTVSIKNIRIFAKRQL